MIATNMLAHPSTPPASSLGSQSVYPLAYFIFGDECAQLYDHRLRRMILGYEAKVRKKKEEKKRTAAGEVRQNLTLRFRQPICSQDEHTRSRCADSKSAPFEKLKP